MALSFDTTPSPQRHTVAELLDAYTKEYLPRKAPQTQYQERLLYRWFVAEFGTIPLAELSPMVLRTWRDSLRASYTPNTIRRYMTSLSAVLTVAVEQYEWIAVHPLRKVAKPPPAPDRERCLTPDEQTRLLAACQMSRNPHLYAVVVLALSTATRKNELLQRQWGDIDLTRGLLSIPQSKNGERRAIPLVPQAVAVLQEQAQHYGSSRWVFPRKDGRKPAFVDYAWFKARARAGLKDVHLHDLRHTSASWLAMSGASLREIAEILGHKSLKQTMRYVHLIEPHTRGVLEKMARQFVDAPGAASVEPPVPVAQVVRAETPVTPSPAPPLSLEIQVLEAVRALAPLPATAIQVAGTLHLPIARVRDVLQQWAHRGTLVRISKGYYRYRPGGPATAAHPQTGDMSRPPQYPRSPCHDQNDHPVPWHALPFLKGRP